MESSIKLPRPRVWRTVILLILSVLALSIAGALIYIYSKFDPEESFIFPKCPFHVLTGLECPGCGSQRAIHSLLNGHLADAFRYNALAVIALPYIAGWVALEISSSWTRNGKMKARLTKAMETLYHGTAAWVVLFTVLAFWVIRNL
jgi:hypothetical protein